VTEKIIKAAKKELDTQGMVNCVWNLKL